MPDVLAQASDAAATLRFLEVGGIVAALAVAARLALLLGLSPIPLYLLAGLVVGTGGVYPLDLSADFIAIGADIGVVLLLFVVGLEYTAEELKGGLRTSLGPGVVNLVANLTPGLLAGLAIGWDPLAAVVLGGITYNTSSGITAKVLAELNRLGNRETPAVLSLLVVEDLSMAVYLPVVAALLIGGGAGAIAASLTVALVAAAVTLVVALRFGDAISGAVSHRSDEVLLLTALGAALVIAGFAQQLQVSSAIGAFLTGIALSGQVADRARALLLPLRDLFAAVFFVSFGLEADATTLGGVLVLASVLAVVTIATSLGTGWYAARQAGSRTRGRWRAGAAMVPRGEFAILVAALGIDAGLETQLAPLATAYVLIMATAGPILMRVVDPVVEALLTRRDSRKPEPA